MDAVEKAWKFDSKDTVRLKATPHVTRPVFAPIGFEKIKVNFAFTLFSDEVLRDLYTYKDDVAALRSLGSTSPMVAFVKRMSRLIAAMTSRCSRGAMRPNSQCLSDVKDFIAYLNTWEAAVGKVGFLAPGTAEGLRVTLASTVSLFEYLTTKLGQKYMLTSRLCQDPLENVFGILRQMSGSNDHPTPTQFLLSANCLAFCSLAKAPVNGNVTPSLVSSLVSKSGERPEDIQSKLDQLMDIACLNEVHDVLLSCDALPDHDATVSMKSDSRVTYYVTGYVACKMLKNEMRRLLPSTTPCS
ncbi:hypothetical protein HPB48_017192 [Haemaphysalis longicornis]|uniref:Transposable element P transposase-like RNase H C-terminal domain-containing protein n=1 Tax=Haemaphysalis longicornis TaxID=44386 RepID=A0A9J6GG61_HAELO|nr:hypothetical protein HPB48_017192 [Haemaphysalis longicornis]